MNQGFYNLFLAVGAIVGVLLAGADRPDHRRRRGRHGAAGTGSMLGAAVVLLVTKPKLLRGVLIQGVAPLVDHRGDSRRLTVSSVPEAAQGLAARSGGDPSAAAISGVPAVWAHLEVVSGRKYLKSCPPDTVFYAVSD